MPIALGTESQPGFDQPLELMKDCHRRIERFIDVLIRVIDETAGGALPDEHRRAIETALAYFAIAAPRHTRDEEDSLFPRMRKSSDPAVAEALERIESLEADHVVATRAHRRVDKIGRRWLENNAISSDEANEMRRTLGELHQAYDRHIRMEDEDIFPLAARVLTDGELEAIGTEMKARRNAG